MNFFKKNIVIYIVFLLVFLVFANKILFSNNGSSIKPDVITVLYPLDKKEHEKNILAWSYSGSIYIIDANLNVKKNLKKNWNSINNIIQKSNSLFILSTKTRIV